MCFFAACIEWVNMFVYRSPQYVCMQTFPNGERAPNVIVPSPHFLLPLGTTKHTLLRSNSKPPNANDCRVVARHYTSSCRQCVVQLEVGAANREHCSQNHWLLGWTGWVAQVKAKLLLLQRYEIGERWRQGTTRWTS